MRWRWQEAAAITRCGRGHAIAPDVNDHDAGRLPLGWMSDFRTDCIGSGGIGSNEVAGIDNQAAEGSEKEPEHHPEPPSLRRSPSISG